MVATQVTCTLGPRSDTPSAWRELAAAGATGFRIPFAKETPEVQFCKAQSIRQISDLDRIYLYADLPGQAPRTTNTVPVTVSEGQILAVGNSHQDSDVVGISLWDNARLALEPGVQVTFGDGELWGEVLTVDDAIAHLRILGADAELQPRRRVAWRGWQEVAVTLSPFDLDIAADPRFGLFDACMLSYVRSPTPIEDMRALSAARGRTTLICAKIEDLQGIGAMTEIAESADFILIGQGDLLVSVGPESFAVAISTVLQWIHSNPDFPVVFGTGLLDRYSGGELSRAELGYLAALITSGCRSFMLAGETTIGSRGPQCVRLIQELGHTLSAANNE